MANSENQKNHKMRIRGITKARQPIAWIRRRRNIRRVDMHDKQGMDEQDIVKKNHTEETKTKDTTKKHTEA